MEPIFYVMAILGCGDGSQGCSQQRVMETRYASVQQCQAAMPAALMRNTDIDYPVVSAACKASGNRMVQADSGRRGS